MVSFVSARDLDRARDFYAGVLGLPVHEASDFTCVFRAGGGTLRVTLVADLSPQPFTVLGWEVDQIRQVIAGLVERGVEFLRYQGMAQDRDGIWTTPGGDLVAWFADPDGNVLSLTQFAGG